MSLDTSEDREGVVEKACNSGEDVGVDRPMRIYARERERGRDGPDG